jgi:hypothetical protein
MPTFISEVHSKLVDEFMNTGKTRMLKTRRELFVKNKLGQAVPVYTYLFVNHLSRKHMILLFE